MSTMSFHNRGIMQDIVKLLIVCILYTENTYINKNIEIILYYYMQVLTIMKYIF